MEKRDKLINLIYRLENFFRKGLRAVGININLMPEEQVQTEQVAEQSPVVEQTAETVAPEAPVTEPVIETPVEVPQV